MQNETSLLVDIASLLMLVEIAAFFLVCLTMNKHITGGWLEGPRRFVARAIPSPKMYFGGLVMIIVALMLVGLDIFTGLFMGMIVLGLVAKYIAQPLILKRFPEYIVPKNDELNPVTVAPVVRTSPAPAPAPIAPDAPRVGPHDRAGWSD